MDDYWSGLSDFHEMMGNGFGQMSREALSGNRNQLDLIITDQMITSSPGAGAKMISLFMTVTWLAGVDRIFIFTSRLWGFTQMGHRLQSSFSCRKAVICDWDRHESKIPGMSGLSEEWPHHLQEVQCLQLCCCIWGGVLVDDRPMCCISGPGWGSRARRRTLWSVRIW